MYIFNLYTLQPVQIPKLIPQNTSLRISVLMRTQPQNRKKPIFQEFQPIYLQYSKVFYRIIPTTETSLFDG